MSFRGMMFSKKRNECNETRKLGEPERELAVFSFLLEGTRIRGSLRRSERSMTQSFQLLLQKSNNDIVEVTLSIRSWQCRTKTRKSTTEENGMLFDEDVR